MLSPAICLRYPQNGIKIISQLHKSIRYANSSNVSKQLTRDFRLFTSRNLPLRNRFSRSQFNKPGQNQQTDALDIGRIAIGAAAGIGLGCLSIYGLSHSVAPVNSPNLYSESVIWPEYVRERIRLTYSYFAGSAAIAAGTAAAMFRSPAICRVMFSGGWAVPIGLMLATMGTGFVCRSMPYPGDGSLSTKHLAWGLFSVGLGAMIMPVCLVGGQILTQAVIYTGGIVGALSLVAVSAPSDQFLSWGGPLSIGLGVVFVSSLGSMFLSPMSRLGSGMAAVSLYGGLLLFSGFLLYDTQLVLKRAKSDPPIIYNNSYDSKRLQIPSHYNFDPINHSMNILMDSVNIFVRLVTILSGQKRK